MSLVYVLLGFERRTQVINKSKIIDTANNRKKRNDLVSFFTSSEKKKGKDELLNYIEEIIPLFE